MQLLLVIVKLAIDNSGVRRRLASGGGELGRRRCVCARSFVFLFLFPEFGECFAVHFNHTLDSDMLEDTDICLSWKL
jgi:hypothetical protein